MSRRLHSRSRAGRPFDCARGPVRRQHGVSIPSYFYKLLQGSLLCHVSHNACKATWKSLTSHFHSILPTTFVPLRFLSITSLVGIVSTLTLLAVLVADGTLKHDAPGSLSKPMPTAVGPRWMRLPLSFGLFMSGFSGHAVVPSLYRDMESEYCIQDGANLWSLTGHARRNRPSRICIHDQCRIHHRILHQHAVRSAGLLDVSHQSFAVIEVLG